ncbi:MAG: GNAT family N-acetyltransferase [Bacteroidota bacterium]
MIFETERLFARPIHEMDLEGFYAMHSNPNVMQYTSQKPMSFDECKTDMQRVMNCYNDPAQTFLVWSVVRKVDNCFIGTCAIILREDNENDMGYRIMEKYWGNGYATEIAAGLIRYGFEVLKKDDLVGVADIRNVASIKIIEKHMIFEKEFYNTELECTDREYRITRQQYLDSFS